MTRIISITFAGAAVLLALVGTAAAGRPVVLEKQNALTRDFGGNQECQQYGHAFTYSEHFDVVRTVTQFLDNEGAVIREVLHIRFVGTAKNDQTGATLPVDGTRHLVIDPEGGTITETGVLRRVTVPGAGIVLHDSGRIVLPLEPGEPLFEAGPHQLFHGDLSRFCAALAET